MRRMMQEWITPKKDETVWDVVRDAMVALLGASIITELIQLLFAVLWSINIVADPAAPALIQISIPWPANKPLPRERCLGSSVATGFVHVF